MTNAGSSRDAQSLCGGRYFIPATHTHTLLLFLGRKRDVSFGFIYRQNILVICFPHSNSSLFGGILNPLSDF